METRTRLEPLAADRARQLFDLMRRASHDPDTALALDDQGRVTGIVSGTDQQEEHMLGDLDVHA